MNGFEYEVALAWKNSGKTLTGVWTISSTFSEKKGAAPANNLISKILQNTSYKSAFQEHNKWWKNYLNKPSVSLPDSALEKLWYIEQYKFGSVARADAPPISLQAVWTADNGKLPPWKGDFHHDLESDKWKSKLAEWPDFALDSLGGLAFARGNPYMESHRHFSHLVGFHPLGIIDWSKGIKDQEIIKATSLLHWKGISPLPQPYRRC